MININKDRVKNSFNRASETYDIYSNIQKKSCARMVENLKKFLLLSNQIADYGCGTGFSTLLLSKNFPFQTLYAIDFAEKLIEKAKEKIKNNKVKFIITDFDKVSFSVQTLDLIF